MSYEEVGKKNRRRKVSSKFGVKPITKIIFGLGNPGAKYKNNRHNIGYKVLDKLAQGSNARFRRKLKINAHLTKIDIEDRGVLLVKPLTFMNNSGICVRKTLRSYGILSDNCLVVYDDVDLALGTIRFRESGSCGGHRGIDSIIEVLKKEEINRLRVGIRRLQREGDLSDYVLSDFDKSELELLSSVIEMAVSACIDWVKFDNNYVMRNYNRRIKRGKSL
ncbi:MAG: aminoacyl-tRNA hydrolase [Candidatus Omnitrophota bacterium]|nr:MAG: aminoacyl-tRNA hydrolase [Candidatus Omnitrophota bacterium]